MSEGAWTTEHRSCKRYGIAIDYCTVQYSRAWQSITVPVLCLEPGEVEIGILAQDLHRHDSQDGMERYGTSASLAAGGASFHCNKALPWLPRQGLVTVALQSGGKVQRSLTKASQAPGERERPRRTWPTPRKQLHCVTLPPTLQVQSNSPIAPQGQRFSV